MGKTIYLSQEQKNKIIYNYTQLHWGRKKSGKEFGVGDKVVARILKEANIPLRNIAQANCRKYNINLDFFYKQSPELAYFIGLMDSDGCVASKENQMYIELQQSDKEILEKLNKIIGNEREVKDYTTARGYKNSKLYFFGKDIKTELAKYRLIPNKTYSKEFGFPYKIDPKYRIDFIRGMFDGDGSIKMTGYSPTFQIDTSNKDMALGIRDTLLEIGVETEIAPTKKENVILYRVYCYGKDKIQKIYNMFYRQDTILFMKRKKDRFEELLA